MNKNVNTMQLQPALGLLFFCLLLAYITGGSLWNTSQGLRRRKLFETNKTYDVVTFTKRRIIRPRLFIHQLGWSCVPSWQTKRLQNETNNNIVVLSVSSPIQRTSNSINKIQICLVNTKQWTTPRIFFSPVILYFQCLLFTPQNKFNICISCNNFAASYNSIILLVE